MAGGAGTRLYPITQGVSKQLLPVGDKPLIFYPISVLMLAGIRDVILICNEYDLDSYHRVLGDGTEFGISLTYLIQPYPSGIADAFNLARDEIKGHQVALILGDNIFYGTGFSQMLQSSVRTVEGATIFAHRVSDPSRFGVLGFNESGEVESIVEKPTNPKSDQIVTGLYLYDSSVTEYAATLQPSSRGELEITDLNKKYLDKKSLVVRTLGRGFAWLDTGTYQSLTEASLFISAIESRQGIKVACLEEIAFSNGWINLQLLKARAEKLSKSSYGAYLGRLSRELKTDEGS